MIKRSILVLIVLLLGCASICAQESEVSAAERGRSEAARDVKEGKFVIKTWGLLEFRINDIPTRGGLKRTIETPVQILRTSTLTRIGADEDAKRNKSKTT